MYSVDRESHPTSPDVKVICNCSGGALAEKVGLWLSEKDAPPSRLSKNWSSLCFGRVSRHVRNGGGLPESVPLPTNGTRCPTRSLNPCDLFFLPLLTDSLPFQSKEWASDVGVTSLPRPPLTLKQSNKYTDRASASPVCFFTCLHLLRPSFPRLQ